jgi:hypothetical protein
MSEAERIEAQLDEAREVLGVDVTDPPAEPAGRAGPPPRIDEPDALDHPEIESYIQHMRGELADLGEKPFDMLEWYKHRGPGSPADAYWYAGGKRTSGSRYTYNSDLVDAGFVKKTRTAQIGNAVPVNLARSLARHLLADETPSLTNFGGGITPDPETEVPAYEEVAESDD